MCTTLFLGDISACNCVAKTTVDQGDYPKVIPKVGLLLNYKTSEYPLIKEVFFLIHSLQGRHFFANLSLGIFFLDSPQLSVILNVQIDRTACLHTLNKLLRSCTVVPGPYQLFSAKKGWRKWLVWVLQWLLGRVIPLRLAIRFHINLWQECQWTNESRLTFTFSISWREGSRNDIYVVKFCPCPPPPKKIIKCRVSDRERRGPILG